MSDVRLLPGLGMSRGLGMGRTAAALVVASMRFTVLLAIAHRRVMCPSAAAPAIDGATANLLQHPAAAAPFVAGVRIKLLLSIGQRRVMCASAAAPAVDGSAAYGL